MSHESKHTIDHDEIRTWVEARGGRPAMFAGTHRGNEEAGMLRIDMPGGASHPPLEPISWDEFFEKFDEANLAFVCQDEKADGEPSFFSKLVSRDSVSESAHR
ncbi:MAG TPA: hypothetical protein VGJ16_03510 [Pirellulales bacterium]